MKKKIMEQWVSLLRSGEFEQGKGVLYKDGKYCCLGVLCVMAATEGVCDIGANFYEDKCAYSGMTGSLPSDVMKWSGVKDLNGGFRTRLGSEYLTRLNDEGKSFNDIADIIEKNWRKL